jgi:SAM-dependent methyltransferase
MVTACWYLRFIIQTDHNTDMTATSNETRQSIAPSPWVVRYMTHIPLSGQVLDLACGSGRHTRLLAEGGFLVLAVDRNAEALGELQGVAGVTTAQLDLEGEVWPLAGQQFTGIVVTNYLWRPRLPDLLALLAPGGVLIYETFMLGNEAFGKPSNPDFLLRPGELREVAATAGLREVAFVEGFTASPKPAMCQAICAVRDE